MTDVDGSSGSKKAAASRVRSAGNRKPLPVPSIDLVRRRLTQAEMQLREMEEELKRVSGNHARELEVLGNENRQYRERIEEIRMEECMAPAEVEALHVGAEQGAGTADSRLIASSTMKYRACSDLIERKRTECAEAEARLAATRQDLLDLRRQQQIAKRRKFGSGLATAYAQLNSMNEHASNTRDQLKTLEAHLARELERFSHMLAVAKDVRTEVDSLLITQSRHSHAYRIREAELYEKRKEMAFLMEVCTLIFEEREQQAMELAELKRISAEENTRYEEAFDELTGVLQENVKAQESNELRTAELHKALQEARRDRVQLEKANEKAQLTVFRASAGHRSRHRSRSGLFPSADAGALSADSDHSSYTSSGSGTEEGEEDAEQGGGIKTQLHEFDMYYEHLAELVDSDDIHEIVQFLNASAGRRFEHFSEMNRLEEEATALREQSELIQQELMESRSKTVEQQERGERMRILQGKLNETKEMSDEQLATLESGNALVERVIDEVAKQFRGVGASIDVIRDKTGMEGVMRATLVECLALVEQRVEEYLLAYSRKQQQYLRAPQGLTVSTSYGEALAAHEQLQQPPTVNAAHSLLRRADLLPSAGVTAAGLVATVAFPHTAEAGGRTPQPGGGGGPAARFNSGYYNSMPEETALGAELPLSSEEARKFVRERMR